MNFVNIDKIITDTPRWTELGCTQEYQIQNLYPINTNRLLVRLLEVAQDKVPMEVTASHNRFGVRLNTQDYEAICSCLPGNPQKAENNYPMQWIEPATFNTTINSVDWQSLPGTRLKQTPVEDVQAAIKLAMQLAYKSAHMPHVHERNSYVDISRAGDKYYVAASPDLIEQKDKINGHAIDPQSNFRSR